MKSILLFLMVPLAVAVVGDNKLSPQQLNQITELIDLLKGANSTVYELLQDEPAIKNCPGTLDASLASLIKSVASKFSEVDWESILSLADPMAEPTRTVPELIEMWSYPVEVHDNIITEDGYILTAHRIPYGRKCGPAEGKRVVFLQHGLLGDSSNWIITGPNQRALAYFLADNCFDVWMGNYRGNTHSRNHIELDPDSSNATERKQFFTFSFHELGVYDLSASIDYVLNVTGAPKLHYVGHSMGTTGMFILLSEKPEYNDFIEDFSALAPVTAIKHLRAFIRIVACPIIRDIFIDDFFNSPGFYEVLPINATLPIAGICKIPVAQELCAFVFYLAGGWSPKQMDYVHLGWITEHTPSGSSQETFIHYAQTYTSEVFTKFNFGRMDNIDKYGQPNPPQYDLSKVNVPIGLFWSDNDLLAERRDVSILRTQLGSNVVLDYKVPDNLFNHLDYIFGKDQMSLVYEPLLKFILRGTESTPDKQPPSSSPQTHLCHTLLTLQLPLAIFLSVLFNQL